MGESSVVGRRSRATVAVMFSSRRPEPPHDKFAAELARSRRAAGESQEEAVAEHPMVALRLQLKTLLRAVSVRHCCPAFHCVHHSLHFLLLLDGLA